MNPGAQPTFPFFLFLQSRTPPLRMVPPPQLILSGNTITDTSKDTPTNTPGILSSNQLDREVAKMGVFNRALCHNCCVMASQQHLSFVHGGGATNFCFSWLLDFCNMPPLMQAKLALTPDPLPLPPSSWDCRCTALCMRSLFLSF